MRESFIDKPRMIPGAHCDIRNVRPKARGEFALQSRRIGVRVLRIGREKATHELTAHWKGRIGGRHEQQARAQCVTPQDIPDAVLGDVGALHHRQTV